MIDIDIESLSHASLSILMKKSNEVVNKWAVEQVYFLQHYGNPHFDAKEYKLHVDTVQSHVKDLKQLITDTQKTNPTVPNNKNVSDLFLSELEQVKSAYGELITYKHNFSAIGLLEKAFFERFSQLERSISSDIEKKIESLTDRVQGDITKGINNLLGLKSELGLAKQFGEKIQEELKMAKAGERRFMLAFISSLLAIPVLNIFLYLSIPNIAPTSSYIVTVSVTFSLLFISYFFYSQYRTYMMLRLRYTHLDGFLGGGATFISQLLESDNQELKLQVNKSLAEMFMSLDDVLHMVHKSKHPTELTLDTAEKVFDKVSKFKR